MEEKELTQTEIITRINSLKIRHDNLKQEIIDHLTSIEVNEKELAQVEEEYVMLISKINA
jgi:hypothetical protein